MRRRARPGTQVCWGGHAGLASPTWTCSLQLLLLLLHSPLITLPASLQLCTQCEKGQGGKLASALRGSYWVRLKLQGKSGRPPQILRLSPEPEPTLYLCPNHPLLKSPSFTLNSLSSHAHTLAPALAATLLVLPFLCHTS